MHRADSYQVKKNWAMILAQFAVICSDQRVTNVFDMKTTHN